MVKPARLILAFLSGVLAVLALFALAACSGGSSGEDSAQSVIEDSDTGALRLEISPGSITEGGLAFINLSFDRAQFDDLDTQGLTLKLIAPSEFDFKSTSGSFTTAAGAQPIKAAYVGPVPEKDLGDYLFNSSRFTPEEIARAGTYFYYIFSLTPELLGKNSSGNLNLTFNVISRPRLPLALADIDRQALSEFNPNKADFDPEAVLRFEVIRADD